ncbi:unnamed protein product [Cuscuta europaea]|uniref:Pectinesterase n=1 Tax=Cuscuta europaea TaxID=41803 RepID=A0A9P0ZFP1_CUSEU|nr:unnamed protein product [Cuscuta europaea]
MSKNLPFLFLFLGLVNGGGNPPYSWFHYEDVYSPTPIVYVDQSGLKNFTTIQSAIDAIPSNNLHWICISIMPGIYREKVTIPSDKQYIYLKGAGMRRTIVVWDDSESLVESPTFTSNADNIKVEKLQFVNSYNYPLKSAASRRPLKPAVAAMINGDNTAFYKCGFAGVQDTLLDAQGRHYFKSCIIEGAIDFIFGAGQSLYKDCKIVVNIGSLGEGTTIGSVTAQGRSGATDSNAFVFKNCDVVGKGRALLGRAWRKYSTTIFINSFFSDIIVPEGWDAWNYKGSEKQLTYAEVNCNGPGSDTSKRVSWASQLSPKMVNHFIDIDFINNDRWLNKQPYYPGQRTLGGGQQGRSP